MALESKLGPQKAVVATVVALVTSAATALLTAVQSVGEGAGIGDLDTAAWLTIVVAVLATTGFTGGATYAVTNRSDAVSVTGVFVDDEGHEVAREVLEADD